MNLLHGDHTADSTREGYVVAAVYVSHEVGALCTTLVNGWAYDSHSVRTIDFFGKTTSAVW